MFDLRSNKDTKLVLCRCFQLNRYRSIQVPILIVCAIHLLDVVTVLSKSYDKNNSRLLRAYVKYSITLSNPM